MKMQFNRIGKIVAAGTLAGLMLGSTIGFAALDAYPAPFVTSDGVQTLVVVGSQGTDAAGLASDVAGAIDIAARLGGEVTTEVSVGGAASIGTISGEGQAVHTTNEKIYLGNHLRKTGLRTALSNTDLPTLLKSGTVTDSDAGTTYDYDQFIDFDNDYTLTFNKISGDLPDPTYMFGEFTTSPTTGTFVYRSRVIFNDEVNGTTVVGEKIELFGNKYTFSSGTSATAATPKVELFGGADTRTLAEGDSVSVTIDGVAYDVKLLVVSDADTIGVQVGTDSKSIDKGKSATVGGLEVFVDDVFFTSKTGTTSSAAMLLGARRLILEDNTQIKTKTGGESEKTLDGTLADITVSGGKLTGIDVYIAGISSKNDYIKAGTSYADPVWKTFNMAFPSITVDVKADSRDYIQIVPSGTKDTDITFTNDRSDRGTIKWAHIDSSADTTPQLADDNNDTIVVLEGALIQRNNYFVTDAGDFSRIFELTSASSLGTSDAKFDIRDVMSGKTIEVKLGSGNATSKVIDGQTYYFNASTATGTTTTNLNVTWGDSSSLTTRGDFMTVWPTMKTKRNAKVALTTPTTVTVTNGTRVNLPTGTINFTVALGSLTVNAQTTEKGDASALSGSAVTIAPGVNGTVTLGRTSTGGQPHNLSWTNTSNIGGSVTIRLANSAGVAVTDPAVILVEEQDDSNNVYSLYVVGDTETRSSNEETSLAAPVFSYSSVASASPDTDSDLTKYVDLWGTYAESKSTDQNKVWIWYPDDQVSANIYILGTGATVSTTTTAAGTVKSAVPIKTSIAKLDREVTSADRSNKNLILVGGPAVNSLVKELATAGKTWTQANYQTQGPGTAILNLVDSAFSAGKSALVVAGYAAADTRTVAGVLQNFDAHKSSLTGKNLVVWKNGVVSTVTA